MARQTHDHIFTEMKNPVTPPAILNRSNRQISPVWKLVRYQAAYERLID
jgi:hypothetical protein